MAFLGMKLNTHNIILLNSTGKIKTKMTRHELLISLMAMHVIRMDEIEP